MKIKTSEITRENTLLSHMILTCLDPSTMKKHVEVKEDRDGDTEYEIKLSFEGEELDIKEFLELLDRSWEDAVRDAAKPYAEELFEERKHTFMSKNSKNAKLEGIRNQIEKANKQIEKANNQLKNIETAFSSFSSLQ